MIYNLYEKFKSHEKEIIECERILPCAIDILHIRFMDNGEIEIVLNEQFITNIKNDTCFILPLLTCTLLD